MKHISSKLNSKRMIVLIAVDDKDHWEKMQRSYVTNVTRMYTVQIFIRWNWYWNTIVLHKWIKVGVLDLLPNEFG